jgi:CRP-like cAMP-binding protein
LLAGLPRNDRQRILLAGEQVPLALAEVLSRSQERIRHVYFPIEGFISLVAPVEGYGSLEVGLVGDEGMLGISLILGVNISPLYCVVQGAGSALRMSAAAFRRELERSVALEQTLKRYLYVLQSQLAQMVGCTRFHLVEARLARWLLMSQDRAHIDAFPLTQEFLAYMLGVRRVGVTKAARALRKRKLIAYSRGNMTILDRRGLESAACGCYAAVKDTYDLIMV